METLRFLKNFLDGVVVRALDHLKEAVKKKVSNSYKNKIILTGEGKLLL